MTKMKKRTRRLIIISAIVLFFIASQFIAVHIIIINIFGRSDNAVYTYQYRYSDLKGELPRDSFSFRSGKNTLRGYIYGDGNDKGLIVLAHGMGGGSDDYLAQIKYFTENGWRVFAYDATGCGDSEGSGTVGLQQSAVDLKAALAYIENDPELSTMKKCLFGHSWGGYGVCAVLGCGFDVCAAASVSGYSDAMEMMLATAVSKAGNISKVMYPLVRLEVKRTFGSLACYTAVDGINSCDIPVLIVHGTADKRVSYDELSIASDRDKITNPNAGYYIIDSEALGGHETIFLTENAAEYVSQIKSAYKALEEERGGKVPESEKAAFYVGVDKARANELNPELMDRILELFENAAADGSSGSAQAA